MDMERKEEIIQATFMLASKNGIDNVSMSQIATQLGIKKPSLYNHFRSKDEIAKAMYDYLRTQAKEKLKITDLDYGKLVKDKSLEEVLKLAVHNYCKMSTQSEMFSFYKGYSIIYFSSFTFTGIPDTISITRLAREAIYWFIHPCMSVNFRCIRFSEVPPMPISLVTKIKVASCCISRSNSALTAVSALSVSASRSKK